MKELTTSVQLSFSRSTLEKHKKGSKSQNLPKKTKSNSMPNNGPSKAESTRPKPKNGQETKKSISKRKVSTIIEERGMRYESYFIVCT